MKHEYDTLAHLWFKGNDIHKAMEKYKLIFDRFIITRSVSFDTPFDGKAEAVEFLLEGRRFQAINAEPAFQFNKSMSLTIFFNSVDELKSKRYQLLSNGGKEMMRLDKYPF